MSQENDEIFLSFDQATNLAHSIVNTLVDITREGNRSMSEISDQISDKLDINFEAVESPAMQIQLNPYKLLLPLRKNILRHFMIKKDGLFKNGDQT